MLKAGLEHLTLSQIDGALTSGLSAAMRPFVDNKYVLTEKAKDGNSIYKLTYDGWPQAINEYCSSMLGEEDTKELLVGFGRLPNISGSKGVNADQYNSSSNRTNATF